MFCAKCGNKNEEGAKFCTNCGEPLSKQDTKETVTPSQNYSSTSNQGGIRKAIKADAKGKIKSSLMGATVVYFVICAVISAIFGENIANIKEHTYEFTINYMSIISEIITFMAGTLFSYGLLAACFKINRGKEVTFSEIFKTPFDHLKEIGYILLVVLIAGAVGFIAGLLAIIPLLGLLAIIALIVAMVYYAPAISTFSMILADTDNPKDLSFTDTVKKALEIVNGHRVEYYGMALSFIGWILLSGLTFGLLLIWLIPYIQLTMVNMYRRWIGEKSFETNKTGLSNGTVIGISVGRFGCMAIIIMVFLTSIIMGIIYWC